ncbi:MAG TPA: ATP-binding cassette domain-containing protein [Gammaproteobacteria bacterium]|nr:ATP-binding cassette domain-containing protein [Gammaproteobacteria bacterium]
MLRCRQLQLRIGGRILFANTSFVFHYGDKVGITGANGCGKSSFFSLILGQLEEDSGSFERDEGITIAHVAQETPAVNLPAIEYVKQGDTRLYALEQQLLQAQLCEDGQRLGVLHQELEAIDGYKAAGRAGQLLFGLGFMAAEQQRPVAEFSGGWRMRLNLARALMCRSDLLLLDEPTNHLDFAAVVWLECWLQHYQGTLLLISHDRDFLDRCVRQIAHIERQQMLVYRGNYTAFELQRAEQLSQQQSAFQRQQRQIAHISQFVSRFRAQATKARQVQSRIKSLQHLQRIAPAHVDSDFNFSFSEPGIMPDPLLRLEEIDAGYGANRVLRNISLTVRPGERLGLLGRNGAGKSTLVKVLAGEKLVSHGQRILGKGLRIGYFAQQQLEQLHPEHSPLQHLLWLDDKATEKMLRHYLGGFGFQGDRVLEPVAPFSGGEKARLVLAMLVYQKPALILLDEPTNHLDLEMRHALTMALQTFTGAMILVSHDRYLLRTVCDSLLVVHDGQLERYAGDLDEYTASLKSSTERSDAVDSPAMMTDSKREQRQRSAALRRQTQPLRQEIRVLEQSIHRLQTQVHGLRSQLENPAIYENNDGAGLQSLSTEYGQKQKQLTVAEETWLERSERLEALNELQNV